MSKDEQEYQIEQSLNCLKEIGIDIDNWAMYYPYGAYNEDTLKTSKSKGCNLGITTKVDISNLDNENKLKYQD